MTTIWLLLVLVVSCDGGGHCTATSEAAGLMATEAACHLAMRPFSARPWRVPVCVQIVAPGEVGS